MAGSKLLSSVAMAACLMVIFSIKCEGQGLEQPLDRPKAIQKKEQRQAAQPQNLQQQKGQLNTKQQQQVQKQRTDSPPGTKQKNQQTSSKSTGVGQTKSNTTDKGREGSTSAVSSRGRTDQLRYQRATPQAQGATGSQGVTGAGSGTNTAAGSTAAKPPSSASSSGSKTASPGQDSNLKPPANSAETYSRLKAAKEALEYYTSGNGRFVKDREAQIEKLRREIGFLESYQKSASTSPASSSQSKGSTTGTSPTVTSSAAGPPTNKPTATAPNTPTKSSQGGSSTKMGGPGFGPTGHMNVYNESGSKVAEKPYWGSGTKADPFRDYEDVNKPFGDRIWGSGTRQDPYTNIGTPPKSPDRPPTSPGTAAASDPGRGAGMGDRERGNSGASQHSHSTSGTSTSSEKDRSASRKTREVSEKIQNLEKEFAHQVKQQEQAIESWFSKTRDEFQRDLKSYQEGRRIIEGKLEKMMKAHEEALASGDEAEAKMINEDLAKLHDQLATLGTAEKKANDWLKQEEESKSHAKEVLKNVSDNFQNENKRLLELSKNHPDAALYIMNKHHLSKWDPKKLDSFQFEPTQNQSPLVNPKTYDPTTDRSKADKAVWRDERKAQIEKEYEAKIQDIIDEPQPQGGAQAIGSSVGKHERIEQLRREKEAKQRQVDINYRESLIKSGRLSQDEYNALNTPEWEEKLDNYRRDLKQGRVVGDRPTP